MRIDRTSSTGSLPTWRQLALVAVLLVLGCGWIYREIPAFGFVGLDDDYNIVFNPHLGGLSPDFAAWAFSDWSYMRRYVPLGWLTFSAVFDVFGLNAAGYHLVALGLQALNSGLLVVILARLLDRWLGRDTAWRRAACVFAGAAFWAWHPLRVESVAWASGLLYQSAIFWLLVALRLHLAERPRAPVRVAAVVCFAASLLCYPIGLGGWVVFVLLDLPKRGWKSAVWRNSSYILTAAAMLAVTLAARIWTTETFHGVAGWQELSLVRRLLQALYVWGHYIWRPLWPVDLTPVDPVVGYAGMPGWWVIAISAIPVVATILVARTYRTSRWPAGFWFAYLAVQVPFLGVIEKPYYPSDRFSFFGHLVLTVACTFFLTRCAADRSRWRPWLFALGCTVLVLLGVQSWRQTRIWRDEATLWAFLAERGLPDALEARYILWRARTGDVDGARRDLDAALRREPARPSLHDLRAQLEQMEAENRTHAARLGLAQPPPLAARLHLEVAARCRQRGDVEAAAWHLAEVQRIAPDYFARITRAGETPPAR